MGEIHSVIYMTQLLLKHPKEAISPNKLLSCEDSVAALGLLRRFSREKSDG
jgi:hypothetical protein